MRSAKNAKRIGFALLGGLLAAGAATGGVLAAAPSADFSLSASPASSVSSPQSLQQGQSRAFTITMSRSNGFGSNVSLGAAVVVSPTASTSSTRVVPSVTPGVVTKNDASAILTVASSSATTLGAYTIRVTGTSGSLTHSVDVYVNVVQPPDAGFTLSASPSTTTMLAGSIAEYSIAINRTSYNGPVALSVTAGLPSGATTSFTPGASDDTSTLQVNTKNNTSAATYTLTIAGGGNGSTVTTSLGLVITDKGKAFAISGIADGPVVMGVPQYLDLHLVNPNNQPLSVTNITVAIQSVTPTTCAITDFAITQVPAAAYSTLTVPANGSIDLIGDSRPQVTLVDDAHRNQDGCKNAQVIFAYTGTGQG